MSQNAVPASRTARHLAVLTGFGTIILQVASLLPTSIIAWNETDTPIDAD